MSVVWIFMADRRDTKGTRRQMDTHVRNTHQLGNHVFTGHLIFDTVG